MKNIITLLSLVLSLTASSLVGSVAVNQPAPNFSLPDSSGGTISLSDYKGKVVVLEWTNPQCPYVQKHYGSGNMPRLQKTYTSQGVVWLTINSGALGKEGYFDAAGANKFKASYSASPSAVLLDPSGTVGHLYDAKTTPHMFVIDQKGTLVFDGAIDSIHSNKQSDVPLAKNYVAAALDEVMAGKPVTTQTATPYGCSVKY